MKFGQNNYFRLHRQYYGHKSSKCLIIVKYQLSNFNKL